MFISYYPLLQWTVLVSTQLILTMCTTSIVGDQTCVDGIDELKTIAEFLNTIPFWPELNTTTFTSQENHTRGHIPSHRCPAGGWSPVIHNSSLCPWATEHHMDNTRFPSTIWYARCLCGHCATDSGTRRYHYCKPLYYAHPVLKKICRNGEAKYVLTYESFPIACICAHHEHREVR